MKFDSHACKNAQSRLHILAWVYPRRVRNVCIFTDSVRYGYIKGPPFVCNTDSCFIVLDTCRGLSHALTLRLGVRNRRLDVCSSMFMETFRRCSCKACHECFFFFWGGGGGGGLRAKIGRTNSLITPSHISSSSPPTSSLTSLSYKRNTYYVETANITVL